MRGFVLPSPIQRGSGPPSVVLSPLSCVPVPILTGLHLGDDKTHLYEIEMGPECGAGASGVLWGLVVATTHTWGAT